MSHDLYVYYSKGCRIPPLVILEKASLRSSTTSNPRPPQQSYQRTGKGSTSESVT